MGGAPLDIISARDAVRFAFDDAPPPTYAYVTPSDSLQLTATSSNVGSVVTVFSKILLVDGTVSYNQQDMVLGVTPRSPTTIRFQLPEGYLISASVLVPTNPLSIGSVFASLRIIRGSNLSQVQTQILCQGYISAFWGLNFPANNFGYPFEGHGNIRSITGTIPAAGAEISESVPNGAIWFLISIQFNLTTGATVANRQVNLTLDDGANVFFTFPPTAVQAASLVNTYCFANAPVGGNTGGIQTRSIPAGAYLKTGFRIRTSTLALQAGDQYTAPQYLVEEWIDV